MCGIIGGYVVHPQRVKGHVTNILEHQKSRGLDGFGLGIRKVDGTLLRYRCEDRGEIFNCSLWGAMERGDHFIFHHRTPTSTPNVRECNHPIMNEGKNMMLIHNGIITKPKLDKTHTYETITTEITYVGNREIDRIHRITDSEWAVHLLEELIDKEGFEKGLDGLGLEYRSAFLMLFKEYNGIIWVSRGYTLWSYKYGGNHYISSLKAIITSDKNLSNTVTKDLDPAYGGMSGGEIDFIKERGWATSSFNTYGNCGNYGGSTVRTTPLTYGTMYQLYTKEWNDKKTALLYPAWLDEIEELDKLTKLQNKFSDDDFKDFLPPGLSLESHLRLFPDCTGLCEECDEFSCFNNPIQNEVSMMAFHP